MRLVLHPRSLYILGGTILCSVILFFIVQAIVSPQATYVTTAVSRGNVTEIVPVSGVIESNNTSHLAFKATDVVSEIYVEEGDVVPKGTVLATLEQDDLTAERQNAVATLEIARANRDELLMGPSSEERDVTENTVVDTETKLQRTILEQEQIVENARRTLFSTNLEALPKQTGSENIPPTISGIYTCTDPGEYRINTQLSYGVASRHDYRLLGLEEGDYTGYEKVSKPMGTCGLSIQFDTNTVDGTDYWIVTIPNMRTSSYVSNYNAYQLALQTKDNEIQTAEEALDAALKEQALENATPRSEALRRANASVLQAEAQLAVIDARIAERTLKAPFSGTVTSVDIVAGEAPTGNVMTIIGDGTFELTARIPEIDIAKIAIGQPAKIVFDARVEETVEATVNFISPLATEIDGVAYFEANITLTDPPSWLRAGLNADVDIITRKTEDALRIPKRFLKQTDTGYVVYIPNGRNILEQPVTVELLGNDGFAAITGFNEGDILVAP